MLLKQISGWATLGVIAGYTYGYIKGSFAVYAGHCELAGQKSVVSLCKSYYPVGIGLGNTVLGALVGTICGIANEVLLKYGIGIEADFHF